MADVAPKSPEKKGGKATGISTEEHFKFLIACIRWSNGGKVNFDEVAKECNVVTKAAAAKRFERLMKAHGIEKASLSNSSSESPGTPTKKAATANGANTKKRKNAEIETNRNGDDEESGQAGKGKKKRVKVEKAEDVPNGNDKELLKNGVKKEEEEDVEV
ncbi:MAG: hypothetical protein Q9222_002227 [Ikaeria aurantiellina]